MEGDIQVRPGSPLPLGARHMREGVNFALFARHARAVTLAIALPGTRRKTPLLFPLDPAVHKTGDIWHIQLKNAPPDLRYGFRVAGPRDRDDTPDAEMTGLRCDERDILLDPYARALAGAAWGTPRPQLGREPCCLLDHEYYDWEGDRPPGIPMRDTIIYELHLRGFTRHPSSGAAHPGTFRGLIEKIDYLKELGVTAVELLPVTEFDESETLFRHPDTGAPLGNYWGYHPLLFGAPKAAYASEPAAPRAALREFRDMVKALHRAGIEVLLDVVFNHTAEGGSGGKSTSFRGIDNSIYYLLTPDKRHYLNFSGCGNTLNCNHPVVRTLIMDMLRWWVMEMHVDGFRFDLASILTRGTDGGILANPPVVELMAEDPVLAGTKIIAEAWDAGGLYQVGSFSTSTRWAEWNGRFRDDARAFMCGRPGGVARLATRIAGSADLYREHGRGPCNSINFITSHDGFTLADLVSYNEKRNRANGEDGRDGDNNNISWNSGAEGPTSDAHVLALRERRIRTFAVILLLSSGVPMLTAGDEFGRTQGGNNNAWNQDNETGWLDWNLARKNRALLRFFTLLIRLRKDNEVFRRTDFFADPAEAGNKPEISWFGPRGGAADWSDEARALAFLLRGLPDHRGWPGDDFFIMLNGSPDQPAVFRAPAPSVAGRRWLRVIDTAAPPPLDICPVDQAPPAGDGRNPNIVRAELRVAPLGCVVLRSSFGLGRRF